jgi:hypothetical protein
MSDPPVTPAPSNAMTPDQFRGDASAPTGAQPATTMTLSPDEFRSLPEGGVQLQPGQVSGYGANIAAGAAAIPATMGNVAMDPFGNMVGKPLAALAATAHDALAPYLGYPKFPPDVRQALTGDVVPQAGDRAVSGAAHLVGLPAPEDVVAPTAGQGIARAVTSAAGLFPIMGGALSVREAAPMMLTGAVAGAGGQAFADQLPDEWKDVGNMAAQTLLGVGTHLAAAPLKVGAGIAKDRINQALEGTNINRFGFGAGPMEPVTDPTTGKPIMKPPSYDPDTGTWVASTEPVMARRGNMAAVGKTLANRSGQTPAELAASVPVDPVAGGNPPATIPGEQATLGQTTGNLRTLGYERSLRNSPEGRAAMTDADARNNQARTDYLGATAPTVGSDAAGNHLRSLLQQHQTDVENAETTSHAATTSALDAAGINAGLPTREALGAEQRGALEQTRQPVKDQASAALDAIDPDGTLAVPITNVSGMAQHILDNEIGPGAVTHGAERPLLNAVAGMDDVQSFSQLRLLMRNTGEAMRQISRNPELGRESAAYRRMSMLMGSIQDSLSESANQNAGGPRAPIYHGGNQVEFGAQDAADLAAANRAYAQYKDRFRTGAVGDVLASGRTPGSYRVTDANVPGRLFRPGQAGVDSINSLIKAAGSPAEALRVLGDAPALSLRDAAVRDGQFDEAAYNKWMRAHGDALDKLPGLRDRFANAATGQQAAEDAATAARQKLNDYQDSAASFYLGKGEAGAHPITAITKLMSNENPAAAAADLMQRAGGSQAAVEGIQRNVIEWLANGARTTAEVGTSGTTELSHAAIKRVLTDPRRLGALQTILTPEQMGRVNNLANSLRIAARSANAVKVPGSPTTAADLHALNHSETPSNLAAAFIGDKLGEGLIGGGTAGTIMGGVGMVGNMLLKAAKLSGLKDVQSLAVDSVINPALGRVMAQSAVKNPRAPVLKQIAQRLATTVPGTIAGVLAQPRGQSWQSR